MIQKDFENFNIQYKLFFVKLNNLKGQTKEVSSKLF
jgi:hypothetical protein